MARIIQEFIKRPLAEELLFGKLVNGGHVEVTLSEDGEKLKLDTRCARSAARCCARRESVLRQDSGQGWRASSGRDRRCGPWSNRRASSRP